MSKNIEIIQCDSFYHTLVTLGKGDVNIIKNSLPEDGFPIVESSSVRKSYVLGSLEISILSDVNLKIEREEFLAINEPSSSEKNTPVNHIGCLDRYTQGHVVRGTNLNRMSDQELVSLRELEISFVFQYFNLVPHLTVIQNVLLSTFVSLRTGIDPKECAWKLFEIVGFHDRMHHRPRELSGDQPEKISTAHTLLMTLRSFLRTRKSETLTSKQRMKSLEYFWT